jgi:Conserved TM helix
MVLADVDISSSIQRGVNEVFAFIPEFIAALVILILGYFVAKVIGNIIYRVLARAGLDRTLHAGQGGSWVQRVTSSPSRLVGKLAFWAIFLGAISLAVSVLGINALTDFVGAVYAYLPHVIAAVLIFLVAGALSAGVATLAAKTMGDTPTGKFVATAAPILIMSIATFMILTELGIAEQIVMITYAGLIGAIALGMALAFGLGGRDVAARMLEGAYQAGQQSRADIRRDIEVGKQRAKAEADKAKDRAEPGNGSPDDITSVSGSRVRSDR